MSKMKNDEKNEYASLLRDGLITKEEFMQLKDKEMYSNLLKEGSITKEDFMELVKPIQTSASVVITSKKREKQKVSFRMPKVLKRAIPFALVIIVFVSVLSFYSPSIRADAPTVAYSSIGNGATFVDVVPGEGVYLTVNVSDGDGNLQSVDIYSNSTGSWASIYGSGALGGVAYHNTSSFLVSDWTGSWTVYYFNITGNDGSPVEFHYSFTTEYTWGDPQIGVLDDVKNFDYSVEYKNATDDYFLWSSGDGIDVKTSNLGIDWALESKSDIVSGSNVYSSFTYNNQPCVYYGSSNLYYATWDGASWSTADTGVDLYAYHQGAWAYACSAHVKYYNGKWTLVAGGATADGNSFSYAYLNHYESSTPLSSFSLGSGGHLCSASVYKGHITKNYEAHTVILDSNIHLIFKDTGNHLHWMTFDGVTWTDRGVVEDNIDGCCLVQIPDAQQIVTIYVNTSGDLVYRVTDNLVSWSDSHLICSGNGYDLRYPNADYIDGRIVVTISYNKRGNYNIYTVTSPDYMSLPSGTNTSYNRIQFPDAQPDATNVFSEVVGFKNINSRDILNVTWHFEDIGDLDISNNIKVYTNMSGGWASIGTCDASGDLAELDISGEMLGGGEWTPGMITYWKFEILDVGGIAETLHATDEDIYMLVDLADE